VLAAGCAQTPATTDALPTPAPSPTRAPGIVERATQAHRQLAQTRMQSGDLAGAVTEWHVVTLLAPDDDTARREYEAARAMLRRGIAERLQQGNAALKSGDNDAAAAAFSRVLFLDPDNGDAARALRDLERQKVARVQSDRAAKLRPLEPERPSRANGASTTNSANGGDGADSYDIEQRIEIFRAGDTAGGLRELHAFVDAHPADRASRQRIGAAVYDRAVELQQKGSREQALGLMDQAVALRGDTPGEWATRMQATRKAVADEYYEKGVRSYRTDLAGAIKLLETSVRYDPDNAKAAAKLREARLAQEKLKGIGN
jgi:tetratricopeptide (TPR) repeat protein